MKKALAVILSVMMLMSTLVACGSKTDDNVGDNGDAAVTYPTKNVNVIVPFSAGGNTDMSMRALLNVATSIDSKYTFVVDNKTGNAGLIGMEALAAADPDGYTLGTTNIDLLLHICFGRTDVTMDNYIPIAATMADPYVLVISASNPNYSNLEEFVEYAKANPGVVKMADSGVGAAPNVAAKAFEKYFDITFDFYTYDGAPECVTAVETNEVDATFLQPTPATASVKAGTLSMIGVLSDERLASFPDTPTIVETFGEEYNLVMKGFVALSAPAGTPDDVVAALRDLMGKAVESDEYKTQIESLGMQYITLYGDELNTFINEQMAFYKDICADIDING